jgi:hypothetical protein
MSGDGGGWIKVSLDRTNSHWAVGNDHDRCSAAGDSTRYYNHLTDTTDYIFEHDTDDHKIYEYDVDYTSAGSTLTESQEGYIRGLVEQVSPNTRPVGVSCDDDSSGIEHNTYLYDGAGNQFELQDGYVNASNNIGWWGWSQDSADSFTDSTDSISGKDNDHLPSSFLMPASVGLQTDANGYAVFAYEESYALFRESGGVKDYSGSNNGGVLYGGPQWTDGRIENALDFDGSDDYVDYDSHITFVESGSNWTVLFWFRPENVSSLSHLTGVESRQGSSWGVFSHFGHDNSKLTWWDDSDGWRYSNTTLENGRWYFGGLSYDGNTTTFWLDGEKDGTADIVGSSNDVTIKNIGRRGHGDDRYYDGALDDVRIYDRALSESEIKDLYNDTKHTVINASQNDRVTDGLVGMWSFNGPDLSGTTATDVSGNGNDGTLTNGPQPAIGKVGQALEFDGGDDGIETPAFNTPTGAISVSAWIKPSAISGDNRQWLVKDSGGGFRSYIHSGDHDISWRIAGNEMWSNTILEVDNWYFVTFTFDPSTDSQKIYINGSLDKDVSNTNDISNDNNNLYLGYDGFANYDWYAGALDEVRIYNRALSESEIKRLYKMGR